MKKLDTVLIECGGVGRGFDSLRIILSVLIVVWHGVVISYGEQYERTLIAGPLGFLEEAILPMFFGLSGFLVIGSAARTNSLGKFLTFRALRIAPALLVEVFVSAILLGGVLTQLPLADYFTSPTLYRYLANIVGLITFRLPGVFETNPVNAVNLSLWTIPSELTCYMFLAICILAGAHLRRAQMLAIVVGFVVAILAMYLFRQQVIEIPFLGVVYRRSNLFACFMAGNLIYLYRDKIFLDARLFIVLFVAGCFCNNYPPLIYLGSALLSYCVVYLGMQPIPKFPLQNRGDYSYGIYLYGFPIQQSIAYLFPESRTWYVNAFISLPLIVAIAALSWHLVEKPALSLKKRLAGRLPRVVPMAAPTQHSET